MTAFFLREKGDSHGIHPTIRDPKKKHTLHSNKKLTPLWESDLVMMRSRTNFLPAGPTFSLFETKNPTHWPYVKQTVILFIQSFWKIRMLVMLFWQFVFLLLFDSSKCTPNAAPLVVQIFPLHRRLLISWMIFRVDQLFDRRVIFSPRSTTFQTHWLQCDDRWSLLGFLWLKPCPLSSFLDRKFKIPISTGHKKTHKMCFLVHFVFFCASLGRCLCADSLKIPCKAAEYFSNTWSNRFETGKRRSSEKKNYQFRQENLHCAGPMVWKSLDGIGKCRVPLVAEKTKHASSKAVLTEHEVEVYRGHLDSNIALNWCILIFPNHPNPQITCFHLPHALSPDWDSLL